MPPITDGEIEIPLDDVPAGGTATDVRVEPAPDKKIIEPDEGVEVLKAKLEEETAARIAAEVTAREATQAATHARSEKQNTDVQLVTNAIDNLKRANDTLQDKVAEAMAGGEFVEASKIQREMLKNEARLNTLETGLEHLKSQPAAPADPVERFTKALSPQSASWVRAHPEYVTDARLNKKMMGAHYDAEGDGLAVDTPEYFAYIERKLGLGSNDMPQTDDTTSVAAQPVQRRQSPPAAPVSRGSDGNGSRPTVVRLTPEEREIAQMNGMTETEYAKNKIQLQREGRLN